MGNAAFGGFEVGNPYYCMLVEATYPVSQIFFQICSWRIYNKSTRSYFIHKNVFKQIQKHGSLLRSFMRYLK